MKFIKIKGFKFRKHINDHEKDTILSESAYLITETGIDYLNMVVAKNEESKWEVYHLETGIVLPKINISWGVAPKTRNENGIAVIKKIKSLEKEKVIKTIKENKDKFIQYLDNSNIILSKDLGLECLDD